MFYILESPTYSFQELVSFIRFSTKKVGLVKM